MYICSPSPPLSPLLSRGCSVIKFFVHQTRTVRLISFLKILAFHELCNIGSNLRNKLPNTIAVFDQIPSNEVYQSNYRQCFPRHRCTTQPFARSRMLNHTTNTDTTFSVAAPRTKQQLSLQLPNRLKYRSAYEGHAVCPCSS